MRNFENTLWKHKFRGLNWNLPCPDCQIGQLNLNKDTSNEWETQASILYRNENHNDWDIELYEGAFIGVLNCNNTSCTSKVSVNGKMFVEMVPEGFQPNIGQQWLQESIYYPISTFPVIEIIHIPRDKIEFKTWKPLYESFQLFWINLDSCANKIRLFLESLMDHFAIRKRRTITRRNQDTYYYLKLHERLEEYKTKEPMLGEHLLAIKWLGNAGSHSGQPILLSDILDAYRILDYFLSEKFHREQLSKEINKISKTINKRKKPLGKKR